MGCRSDADNSHVRCDAEFRSGREAQVLRIEDYRLGIGDAWVRHTAGYRSGIDNAKCAVLRATAHA